MEKPVTISLENQSNSQNFAFLREEGLNVIRRLAPDTWSDHNLHDPGITLLEALSYAITDAGFITSLDMLELLTSSEKKDAQEFFTAARVLPSSPVSVEDFQKVLVDHPLVKRAWVSALYGEPLGRLSVLLEFQKEELNSNVLEASVNLSPDTYRVDFALPYWDEIEIAPLQQDVPIQAVNFINAVNPWQQITGNNAYFARITVDYQPPGVGTANFEAWVVMQIISEVEEPATKTPLILQAAAALLQVTGDNSEFDQTIFKQYNRRVTEAFNANRNVRRYLKNYRNLCEVFAEYIAARVQEVAITANIEVSPNVNVENLAADIFLAVDNYISPEYSITSLPALQEAGVDSAVIFDGPLPHYGFVEGDSLHVNLATSKLYASDVLRLILQLRKPGATDIQLKEDLTNRSIVAVRNLSLSLYIDNRIITTNAKDCLQLINSIRYVPRLSTAKCRLTFMRNGVEVSYDIERSLELFAQKKLLEVNVTQADTPDIPIPQGISYPIGEYYPVQNSLPVTYGVGVNGLPFNATPQRKAQAKQLKGYLFFFEQILAGHFAQLAKINTFFSARTSVQSTTFQQPLYNLPDVADLLIGFDPAAETWLDFIADEDNLYRTTLEHAAETESQFLDRRNRMLNHLLARLGESMNDLEAMAYRESYRIPNASSFSLEQLQVLQEERRIATAKRLLKEKSDFYYDLPFLHKSRLQSFGLPDWKKTKFIFIQKVSSGFEWQILNASGAPILQQNNAEPTETAARLKAEEVLSLATSVNHYSTVPVGGGNVRLEIKSSNDAESLARSVQIFSNLTDANNAIPEISNRVKQLWVSFSLSALEAKLYHLLEIQVKGERRLLTTPIDEYFEIFDDTISTKKFRLRQLPGASGNILLESDLNYVNAVEAVKAIHTAIENGILPEYYSFDPVADLYTLSLKDYTGNVIASSPDTYANFEDAEQQALFIRQHLYRYYSGEGFYMIEHLLLAPKSAGDSQLQIIDSENPCIPVLTSRKDPYSFQITFVFPSGYEKNFNTSPPGRQESRPNRFRDEEYRAYAENTIRKACPGHIFPSIMWVDRATPGIILPPDTPSFENFEARYRQWLAAYFTDEVEELDLAPLRNSLVDVLNNIYAAQ